jgi:hypothetical protein
LAGGYHCGEKLNCAAAKSIQRVAGGLRIVGGELQRENRLAIHPLILPNTNEVILRARSSLAASA